MSGFKYGFLLFLPVFLTACSGNTDSPQMIPPAQIVVPPVSRVTLIVMSTQIVTTPTLETTATIEATQSPQPSGTVAPKVAVIYDDATVLVNNLSLYSAFAAGGYIIDLHTDNCSVVPPNGTVYVLGYLPPEHGTDWPWIPCMIKIFQSKPNAVVVVIDQNGSRSISTEGVTHVYTYILNQPGNRNLLEMVIEWLSYH